MEKLEHEVIKAQEVTVKSLTPIYTIKYNVEANSIELLNFEENGFDVIVGKGLYTVGQKLFYALPDTNIKEGHPYLDSYINPTDKDGNPISSKLGGKNRIKSIGFNFSNGNGQKLYSNGIVCPMDVSEFLYKYDSENDSTCLKTSGGKAFPSFLYKTDETNYKSIVNKIKFPITLLGTLKTDGSSESVFINNDELGICSRNLLKPLVHKKQVGIKYKIPFANFIKKYIKLPKWCSEPIYEYNDSNDDFVKYGKPYLPILETAWNDINNEIEDQYYQGIYDENSIYPSGLTGLCIRCELCGESAKGSGNKNNPHSKKKTGLECFGVDYICNGRAIKQGFEIYKTFCDTYNIPRIEVLIEPTTFNSKEELEEVCENIFKERLIEGIVLRNMDSTFSTKYMNNFYDSKK